MTHLPHIGSGAVQASVEKILKSDTFSRSEKLRAFLEYVVEKEQKGQAQNLKGYSIGVDVFGRPEAFDPTSDPLVRVQAGKLRKLLERYYDTEGLADPVRITIPVGGYVPRYRLNHSDVPPPQTLLPLLPSPADAPGHRLPGVRGRSRIGLTALVGFTLLNLFVAGVNALFFAFEPATRGREQEIALPPGTALPRVMLDAQAIVPALGGPVVKAILTAGSSEPAIDLISAEQCEPPGTGSNGRLDFTLRVRPDGSRGDLNVTLTHNQTGYVLYTALYQGLENAPSEKLEAMASDLVSTALPVSGHIYRFAAQSGYASALMQCMEITDLYRRTNSRHALTDASACQSKLVPGLGPQDILSNLRMLRDASRHAFNGPVKAGNPPPDDSA